MDIRRPREDLAWTLVAVMSVVSGVGIWWLIEQDPVPGATFSLELWQVIVGFFIAERLTVHLYIRDGGINTSLVEVPIAVCLMLAAPAVFIGGRTLGIAIALVPGHFGKSSDTPALKTAFNVAMVALSSILTIEIYHLVLGGGKPAAVRGWFALVIAIQLADAWGLLMIGLVMRLVQPSLSWSEIVRSSVFSMAVTATLAIVGVFLAVATWHDESFLVLDLLALGGVYWLLRIYGTLGAQYQTLGRLYEYSRDLTASTSVLAGATASLTHGAALMGTNQGMLFVPWADEHHYWVLRDGQVDHLPINKDTAMAVTDMLDGSEGMMLDLAGDTRPGARVLQEAGFTSVAMGTVSGHGGTGWLLFASRPGRFKVKRMSSLIANVAGQSAAALGRTELVDRLRDEAVRQKHATLHDRLTGLPNRDYFIQRLDELVTNRPARSEVAVLIVDLDRFKEVNDSLGHEYGDQVLKEVADRLRHHLRSSEFLARLGGDEFGILHYGPDAAANSAALADRVADLLEEPVHVNDTSVAAGGSIGISLCPRHDEDAAALMRYADIAMYTAKQDGLRFFLFEAETEHVWMRRVSVLRRLQAVDLADVIQVYFQPKVDLMTGKPIGAEALARWTDPELGVVSPVEFIPIAEQSGLIQALTAAVLAKALPSLTTTSQAGHPELTLSVNLSGRALLDLEIVTQMADALNVAGVSPDRLTIEVTESVFVSDSQRLNDVLLAYEDLGVTLSIDDFGTGYSSLSYLRRLPASELKIDRSFIDGMIEDASKLAIVKSTVALAHELGMSAVAEGIEDVQTMALLRSINCDVGQGFLMGRPMPLSQYIQWLSNPTIPQNFELDKAQLLHRAPPLTRASLRDN